MQYRRDEDGWATDDPVSRVGWRNFVAGGRCSHLFDGHFRHVDVTAGYSSVRNDAVARGASNLSSNVRRYQLEVTTTTMLANGVPLEAGAHLRLDEMNYSLGEFFGVREDESFVWSTGVFAELAAELGDRVDLRPGLFVSFTGPSGVEPRLRAAWRPFGRISEEVTGAVGLYRQAVTGVSDTRDVGSVFVAWTEAFEKPTQALHAQLGWQHVLERGWEWSIEGYYRRIHDLSVPVWDTEARFNPQLALANGTVRGLDLRIEHVRPGVYAFLGYGYARTRYEAAQDNFSIWFGEPVQRYSPPHDRRHQVSALASVDLGRYTVSGRWQLGTGLPYTRPIGFDEAFDFRFDVPDIPRNAGRTRILVDRPYEARMPPMHRLDVSVERDFHLSFGTVNAQAGVINLYDQTNLFYFDLFTGRRVDQMALAPYVALQLGTR